MNKEITVAIDDKGRIWHNGMRYFSEEEIHGKIKLIRSIIPLSPTSARINLTMIKGESYLLMDSVVVVDVKTIKTNAMRHKMDLVFE